MGMVIFMAQWLVGFFVVIILYGLVSYVVDIIRTEYLNERRKR